MPKTQPKHISTWNPSRCKVCKYPFDQAGWESDYAMSGELVWICPKCRKVHYEPLEG